MSSWCCSDPSGCGKSTLLRMIAGLELPTSGDIYIGDRRATRLPPRLRNIAMVFQNYALYPHLTLFENIAFPLRIRHMPRSEVKQRVEWAASLVQIQHLLSRKPRQTSGGERQRTALARSLVRNPEVFLFDEPLSNLDSKLRHSARDELREFHKKTNVTAIYVTHDQVEAMTLGDRIVVMNAGEIRQIGTPGEVYTRPADSFVATFLGSPPRTLVPYDGSLFGFRLENFAPEDGSPTGAKASASMSGAACRISRQRHPSLWHRPRPDPANRLIRGFLSHPVSIQPGVELLLPRAAGICTLRLGQRQGDTLEWSPHGKRDIRSEDRIAAAITIAPSVLLLALLMRADVTVIS